MLRLRFPIEDRASRYRQTGLEEVQIRHRFDRDLP